MSATFVQEDHGIEEYQLPNGLKVLLVENHAAPIVTVLVVYRVGSRNEAVGHTGATHFLEHMLFKGTPSFNKAQGSLIAQVLTREGANYNATTWLDRTTYYETLPIDKFELALQIESERMHQSFVRDKDRQMEMTVVRNELERDESEPDSIMWKHMFAHAFLAHPYHHPTIGWNSDVEGVPTSDLRKFYKLFYHPNNATLIVVGDVQRKAALDMIDQYFGTIPPSKKPIPTMYTQEFMQQGERRFTIKRPGQLGLVQMGYHVPPVEHPDSYALDVLQDILSDGVSSRLYQGLVEKQLALYAGAYNIQLRDPGLFMLSAKVTSGIDNQTVEAALNAEIEKLQKQPPTARELERVRNQTKAAFSYNRHGNHQLATMLGEFESMASWRYLVHYLDHLEAVTPEDVQRVAQTYLKVDNRTVGWFIPGEADSAEVQVRQNVDPPAKTQKAPPKRTKQAQTVIDRHELDHGVILLTQENHIDNTVAFQGRILAGGIFNGERYGLSEMTAAMLKKGTQKYDKLEIADALAHLGSSLEFRTGTDAVGFSGRCLAEHLDATLDLLEQLLKKPTFPEGEFDKLKKQRIDRLKQRLDSADAMAYDVLFRDIYPVGHPHYQPTVDELISATEAISLKDIKAFYKRHYGQQGMLISVVGDISASRVQQRFASLLKGWNTKNPGLPAIPDQGLPAASQRLLYPMPDKSSVSIFMGHPTPLTRLSPDFFPALLANQALGQSSLSSRLGMHVRDNLGLTYGIYSYFSDIGRGSGPWVLSVTTNPDNVEKTIAESLKVVNTFLAEGMTAQELEDAKSSLIGSYLVNLATHPEIAYHLLQLEQYGLGLDYFQRRADEIRKVTLKQANGAARKYIRPEHLVMGLAGEVG